MITVDGKTYPTIEDAAKKLGNVSAKTVRAYIANGIIPEPPTIDWGLRTIAIFPSDYIRRAKDAIKRHRSPATTKKTKARKTRLAKGSRKAGLSLEKSHGGDE